MEIGVRDLRNRTGQVIEAVQAGELVTLTVRGEPVADIVPHGRRARWLGGERLREQLRDRAADSELTRDLNDLSVRLSTSCDRVRVRAARHVRLHRARNGTAAWGLRDHDAHAFHLFWSSLPEAADAIEAAGAFIREVGDTGRVQPRASVRSSSPAAK